MSHRQAALCKMIRICDIFDHPVSIAMEENHLLQVANNPLGIPSPSSSIDLEEAQQPASAYFSIGKLRELEERVREKNLCNCLTQYLSRRRGSLELPRE